MEYFPELPLLTVPMGYFCCGLSVACLTSVSVMPFFIFVCTYNGELGCAC